MEFCPVLNLKLKGEFALAYESYAGEILIVLIMIIIFFTLYYLTTMSPLRWHHPHLVDNIDNIDVWGTSTDHSVGFVDFFSCAHLLVYLSVSLCICLLTVNFKFLKTRYYYWLAQHLYVNLVSGLELKKVKTAYQNGKYFF